MLNLEKNELGTNEKFLVYLTDGIKQISNKLLSIKLDLSQNKLTDKIKKFKEDNL